ncbi:DUF3299 domain-containing protein [Tropicibacter sp. Alg240-R139]|uniref:HoxN/HupN/NixA family nickel/cobalt transporter n=1 Tax=Tropicibacter sp. Alg240-R139 TaxID=2305991 RepID=UPI0013E00012|nr:DUF3299 domain-containing protein [Tropicibacter sp. Alg240-R139]
MRLWRLQKTFLHLLAVAVFVSAASASEPQLVTWDALAPSEVIDAEALSGGPLAQGRGASQPPALASDLLDRDIVIDGYALPVLGESGLVTEFLLVPWVGACVHTPAPPPNQIIHVSYPDGLQFTKHFEPVRISGILRHEPADHPIYLVDGARVVSASYALTEAKTLGLPEEIIASSANGIPVATRIQIWVNELFTDSMLAIDKGGSIKAMLMALLLCFGYGALHTLGPGHGKSVVISYFVGTGGNLRRGLTMGVRIAIFHVLSAVVIVLLLDFAVRSTTGSAPSDFRAIRLASYALVMAIGGVMLWQAIASILARQTTRARAVPAHGDHDHDHNHHDHRHHAGHDHSGCAACAASSNPKGSGWIAASVGIVPCTGALLVMLFGLANDLVWPAVLMVVAISAGMAAAMSAIGIAALWGRGWAERRFATGPVRRAQFESGVRLAGASCVFAIGALLFSVTLSAQPIPLPTSNDVTFNAAEHQKAGG